MAKVLVVDDEPVVRALVCQFLQIDNHSVTDVASGREALEVLASTPIDAVLTDLSMPGMTGLELRTLGRRLVPEVPFIVMSGHFIDDRLRDQFDAALEKPLDIQSVLDAVDSVLSRNHLAA